MSEPTSILSGSQSGSGYGSGSDGGGTTTRPTRRPLVWNAGTDTGLLLLRVAVGGTFLAHGAQKVFGLWGGPGPAGFARMLESYGYQQATALSWVTGISEVVLGGFVLLGLLTPLAAAGLLAVKINAVLVKVDGGFSASGFFIASPAGAGAIELDVVLGLAAAALVLTGPGRIALDNGRPWHRRPTSWGVLALLVGVAVAVLVRLLLRG